MATVTIDELRARLSQVEAAIHDLDASHTGERFDDDAQASWNGLNEEREELRTHIGELETRQARLVELAGNGASVERGTAAAPERTGAQFQVRRPTHVPDDPTDLSAYRSRTSNMEDLERAYEDGAMRIVDRMRPVHEEAGQVDQQAHIERMLATIDHSRGDDGASRSLARRIIATSSPTYERAFGKYLAGKPRTHDEERALGLTAGSGGYAVPVTLDPTIILTSNGVVNPMRAISRIERITGTIWDGVASTGITAGYGAEGTEASDNAPSITQPTLTVEKAFAFVPFSIEISEDWAGLQGEMARLLQDAKDTLESTKFCIGAGHGSTEPQGLLVGATAVVSTATTAVFAVADLYSTEEALAPRWRPRASIVANKKWLNKIRQFDTAGGANLWVQLGNGTPSRLLDYPTYEYSDMPSAATSSTSIVTIGDFNQFLIVDKIGLNVEVIPHLFATANNRPSGTRGLYAYWRNSSVVLAQQAFKTTKLL